MIRRLQALNFRCLRHVDIDLDEFHVVVGPNGSGKSAFFDALAFVGDLVRDGLVAAVERRTHNFQDLVWGRPQHGLRLELAMELGIPDDFREKLGGEEFRRFRYEVALAEDAGALCIAAERGLLLAPGGRDRPARRVGAPLALPPVRSVLHGDGNPDTRTVLSRSDSGRAGFHAEILPGSDNGGDVTYAVAPNRSALSVIPPIPEDFPVATWVQRILRTGVRVLSLSSSKMRNASPPRHTRSGLRPDGANLPWLVRQLEREARSLFDEWIRHVRAALDDLVGVSVRVRPDDRHAYLVLQYENGVQVPSWAASDGTLRFLALTLLAFLPSSSIYLIEEPENGLHPFLLDFVYDLLWSSANESQVLTASHSPALLKLARPDETLCFANRPTGATYVIRGPDHPLLRDWRGRADADVLLAHEVFS